MTQNQSLGCFIVVIIVMCLILYFGGGKPRGD